MMTLIVVKRLCLWHNLVRLLCLLSTFLSHKQFWATVIRPLIATDLLQPPLFLPAARGIGGFELSVIPHLLFAVGAVRNRPEGPASMGAPDPHPGSAHPLKLGHCSPPHATFAQFALRHPSCFNGSPGDGASCVSRTNHGVVKTRIRFLSYSVSRELRLQVADQ